MRSWLCALALLLHSSAVRAYPYEASFRFIGPLGMTQENPLRQALIDVPLAGPVDRPTLRIGRGASNIWNGDTSLQTRQGHAFHTMDLQQETLNLDVVMPLGRFFSVGGRLGVAQLWGGGPVDGIIETFHHTFDFYNFERGRQQQGRTVMRIEGPSGPTLSWNAPRAIVQNPLLSMFARVMESRRTRVMVRVDAQLPVGDVARTLRLFGPEVGTGVSVMSRLAGILQVQVAANAMFHGNRRIGGLTVNPVQWIAEGSLELRLLPFLTFLVEDRIQTPLFERNAVLLKDNSLSVRATAWNGYFTPVNLISFGPRLYLPLDATLTIYASEDFMFCTECYQYRLSRETNAPDISGFAVLQQALPAMEF